MKLNSRLLKNGRGLFVKQLKTWQLALILIIVRIPYIILFWPGLMIYDSASSIAQFYGITTYAASLSTTPSYIYTDHHMILFTFLMGSFIKFGELVGNQNIGFFLYIFLQVVISNIQSNAILRENPIFCFYNTKPYSTRISFNSSLLRLGTRPVIRALFWYLFYTWSLVLCFIIILIRKDLIVLLGTLPVFLSLCFLIISPVLSFRYYLPVIYSWPLIIGLTANCGKTRLA